MRRMVADPKTGRWFSYIEKRKKRGLKFSRATLKLVRDGTLRVLRKNLRASRFLRREYIKQFKVKHKIGDTVIIKLPTRYPGSMLEDQVEVTRIK